jgi:hypothetical protein
MRVRLALGLGVLGLGLLGLGLLGPACVTSAQPRPAERSSPRTQSMDERVRALLSGIEDAPSRAEMLALGMPGFEALVRLEANAAEPGALRLRAITCAGWFHGERPRAYLRGLLASATEPLRLRAAIRAYGANLESTELASPDPLLEPITRHARHEDPAVREAVYLTLVAVRAQAPASARAAITSSLETLLASETDAELVQATRARMSS